MRQIGTGQYGVVSQALLSSSTIKGNMVVVVKTINDSSTSHIERVHALQEAAVMSRLSHNNIVKLIGVVTIGNPVMIVIEYCSNGSLKEYFETASPPDEMLQRFSMDCALGMAYLASENIVHRDLAARNVLVDSDSRCKISDYGMSRVLDDKTYYRSFGAALPVRWTAPEALEEQIFTEKSDVWSFGVLLYEIWTNGALPYEGMSERKVWVEVVGGYRMPVPVRCSGRVGRVMAECWRESRDRPWFKDIVRSLELQHRSVPHQQIPKSRIASSSSDLESTAQSSQSFTSHVTDV